jgi:MEDS: MEthanogen/methylotroph, DcmR Sensory domain
MLDGATSDGRHPHLVQLYRDADEIATAAGTFLAEGLAAGEPAVAIATTEHRAPIVDCLRVRGFDPARLQERGTLVLLDADPTLATILDDGVPSPARFDEVIGGLVTRLSGAAGGMPVRAYGEMVDLLWQRGDPEGAVALEELWNGLAERADFSLLCGYRVDVFDRTAQIELLPGVCRTHSGVAPGADAGRVERAVETALAETLGRPDAEKVYALVDAQRRKSHVPRAQLALMWVSAHMPRTAERVMAAARAHYGEPVPA